MNCELVVLDTESIEDEYRLRNFLISSLCVKEYFERRHIIELRCFELWRRRSLLRISLYRTLCCVFVAESPEELGNVTGMLKLVESRSDT